VETVKRAIVFSILIFLAALAPPTYASTGTAVQCPDTLRAEDLPLQNRHTHTELVQETALSETPIVEIIEANYRMEDAFDAETIQRIQKFEPVQRLLDQTFVIVSAPVWLPIIALSALITKLSSEGPILFVQQRVGKNGEPFKIYKLRTMRPNSGGPDYTASNDSRVTPFGKLARRWKIDELLQVWNIFKGDMSVVGPRPMVDSEARRQLGKDPSFGYRLLVPPGLTGLAQINTRWNEEEQRQEDPLEYALLGIQKHGLKMYLRTILETLPAIFLRKTSH
jgi:lipopolysaccharide/colanic/teichoic acid biosynthesis glycosyltransferase